jgi:hypothetical protein
MKIRCKQCGEYFCPSDESVELISDGFMSPENVNICDDCWDILELLHDDNSEIHSDADPGL